MEPVAIELGTRHGPFPGALDPEAIARYAAATNDTNPPVLAGTAVPATFPVILIFDAQWAANGAVPKAVYQSGRNGVHGEHEVRLHRPLVPGESLETWSEPFAVCNTRAGARVVLHMEQFGADGALAVEHWWTIFFPGCDLLADVGPEPPDHTFPDAARTHHVGSVTQHVDADIATRYAEVSNDWSAHHFEIEHARNSGVDYLFAHGLCTMAMCAQATVGLVAGGDPSRVRRVAVRFATPTRLDADLTVDVYDAGDGVYAFEATCADDAVIKHGRLELFN
jgi:acyl dehydratase